ncbi:MAG: hypothetical protein ISR69_10115 [Gammaproteobacteria bacterium]|nr:hypothetical protein [Gammaproteobacteria bacterium]
MQLTNDRSRSDLNQPLDSSDFDASLSTIDSTGQFEALDSDQLQIMTAAQWIKYLNLNN